MKHIAPEVWPKGNRACKILKQKKINKFDINFNLKAFCYAYRKRDDCQAKDGNPFGPYWDKFGIGIFKTNTCNKK